MVLYDREIRDYHDSLPILAPRGDDFDTVVRKVLEGAFAALCFVAIVGAALSRHDIARFAGQLIGLFT